MPCVKLRKCREFIGFSLTYGALADLRTVVRCALALTQEQGKPSIGVGPGVERCDCMVFKHSGQRRQMELARNFSTNRFASLERELEVEVSEGDRLGLEAPQMHLNSICLLITGGMARGMIAA